MSQTDGRTDRLTDNMRSQDRALQYSASRGKSTADRTQLSRLQISRVEKETLKTRKLQCQDYYNWVYM